MEANEPCSAYISHKISAFTKKSVRCAIHKLLNRCISSKSILTFHRGAILIEFAVCIPILIILMFYINDLVRIKRYYAQTEFVGQQTVNMIQNISQKRDNKAITKTDLVNIHALTWSTFYPGVSMLKTNSVYPAAHKPITSIYYIKGLDNGKASCIWRTWTRLYENPSKIGYNSYTSDGGGSVVRFLTNTSPSNIYPTLKINSGEVKIIIETLIERQNGTSEYKNISDQESVGTHFINPTIRSSSSTWSQMLHSVVIFTPKPGLFSETAPS